MKQETQESLDRYAEHGIPTGSFLRAVLSNDLTEAVCRADDENRRDLLEIVKYVYNEMPSMCHGSSERVSQWVMIKAAKREKGTVAT